MKIIEHRSEAPLIVDHEEGVEESEEKMPVYKLEMAFSDTMLRIHFHPDFDYPEESSYSLTEGREKIITHETIYEVVAAFFAEQRIKCPAKFFQLSSAIGETVSNWINPNWEAERELTKRYEELLAQGWERP